MDGKELKGFMRIGDIVCITFNEKVFEGDFKNKEKRENGMTLQLARITETPEMVYKGVLWSKVYSFIVNR